MFYEKYEKDGIGSSYNRQKERTGPIRMPNATMTNKTQNEIMIEQLEEEVKQQQRGAMQREEGKSQVQSIDELFEELYDAYGELNEINRRRL